MRTPDFFQTKSSDTIALFLNSVSTSENNRTPDFGVRTALAQFGHIRSVRMIDDLINPKISMYSLISYQAEVVFNLISYVILYF